MSSRDWTMTVNAPNAVTHAEMATSVTATPPRQWAICIGHSMPMASRPSATASAMPAGRASERDVGHRAAGRSRVGVRSEQARPRRSRQRRIGGRHARSDRVPRERGGPATVGPSRPGTAERRQRPRRAEPPISPNPPRTARRRRLRATNGHEEGANHPAHPRRARGRRGCRRRSSRACPIADPGGARLGVRVGPVTARARGPGRAPSRLSSDRRRSAGADSTGLARRPRRRTRTAKAATPSRQAGATNHGSAASPSGRLGRAAVQPEGLGLHEEPVRRTLPSTKVTSAVEQSATRPAPRAKAAVAVGPLPLHIGQLVEEVGGGDAREDDDDEDRERRQAVHPDRLPDRLDWRCASTRSILDPQGSPRRRRGARGTSRSSRAPAIAQPSPPRDPAALRAITASAADNCRRSSILRAERYTASTTDRQRRRSSVDEAHRSAAGGAVRGRAPAAGRAGRRRRSRSRAALMECRAGPQGPAVGLRGPDRREDDVQGVAPPVRPRGRSR